MRRWISSVAALIVSWTTLVAAPARAVPHEARVPLHEGKIRLSDFSRKLLTEMHCPDSWANRIRLPGTIDVHDLGASKFVEAMNASLGDACRLSFDGDAALILKVDCEKLPKDWDATKVAVRVFTACAAPEYTAAQQREFGLLLPETIDPQKPMVVLIHGLDCNYRIWRCIASFLERDGYQVAYFNYPGAQRIVDSADFFAQNVVALRETYPSMRLDVITHSMGSLVAREYVEGPQYAGGINHLILLTPPNNGSGWARAEVLLKAQQNYYQWRNNPDWRWTWMITDGMGEAGSDLLPGSAFLKQLNDRPRRDGVRYTVIAGNRNPVWETAGDVVGAPARWFPKRTQNWWGFRHTRHGIEKAADKLRTHDAGNDGPVSLKSAQLAGVSDFVVLPTDHAGVYCGDSAHPPAAWPTIRDRLAR